MSFLSNITAALRDGATETIERVGDAAIDAGTEEIERQSREVFGDASPPPLPGRTSRLDQTSSGTTARGRAPDGDAAAAAKADGTSKIITIVVGIAAALGLGWFFFGRS